MTYGRGKWPSLQYVTHLSIVRSIYGSEKLPEISPSSIYGRAFLYADKTLNGAEYTGDTGITSHPDALRRYFRDAREEEKRLDFVLYVPEGYGSLEGEMVPNVVETDDPQKIFTVGFDGGQEVW